MATAIQKITLSSSRDIPFNKLVLSQSNVRRVKAGVSIEELAEDIARRTLLQGLNVRPILDAEGAETSMFEIPAGGRRYRALELLVKQKRLAKTAPVPCVVRDPTTDILGEDDSLAENIQRAPLHPLDQFRAFQALREKGRSEEDIAAAFFVGVNVVKQRLRLASVAPGLLDVYAEDGMSLEQLMAFTVTADHARQEQVWQAISGSWQKEPYQIRRMLTEKTVRASDRRAVFVGLDAYKAAGGVVLRDLFQSDDGGWLEDIALLDGLVAEKLKAEAETIAAEGWKWIEVAIDFPYGHTGEEQAALFAHCASFGVNALYEKGDRYGAGVSSHTVEQRIAEADRLAQAVDLDMVQAGWRPTVENYLGRVPKRRILEAVQEGAGERSAQLIDHLKKGDMAKEAERLLADTGWLPEPLRIATADDAPVETAEAEDDVEALPEFLAGDDEETDADAPQVIAAE